MEKIKIHDNKRLKLINVITKELRNVSSANLYNEIRKADFISKKPST